MTPETIRTMATHTAYLCLVAELAKAGLVDIGSLADSIEHTGNVHRKAVPEYGDLIIEFAKNVRSIDPFAPKASG